MGKGVPGIAAQVCLDLLPGHFIQLASVSMCIAVLTVARGCVSLCDCLMHVLFNDTCQFNINDQETQQEMVIFLLLIKIL